MHGARKLVSYTDKFAVQDRFGATEYRQVLATLTGILLLAVIFGMVIGTVAADDLDIRSNTSESEFEPTHFEHLEDTQEIEVHGVFDNEAFAEGCTDVEASAGSLHDFHKDDTELCFEEYSQESYNFTINIEGIGASDDHSVSIGEVDSTNYVIDDLVVESNVFVEDSSLNTTDVLEGEKVQASIDLNNTGGVDEQEITLYVSPVDESGEEFVDEPDFGGTTFDYATTTTETLVWDTTEFDGGDYEVIAKSEDVETVIDTVTVNEHNPEFTPEGYVEIPWGDHLEHQGGELIYGESVYLTTGIENEGGSGTQSLHWEFRNSTEGLEYSTESKEQYVEAFGDISTWEAEPFDQFEWDTDQMEPVWYDVYVVVEDDEGNHVNEEKLTRMEFVPNFQFESADLPPSMPNKAGEEFTVEGTLVNEGATGEMDVYMDGQDEMDRDTLHIEAGETASFELTATWGEPGYHNFGAGTDCPSCGFTNPGDWANRGNLWVGPAVEVQSTTFQDNVPEGDELVIEMEVENNGSSDTFDPDLTIREDDTWDVVYEDHDNAMSLENGEQDTLTFTVPTDQLEQQKYWWVLDADNEYDPADYFGWNGEEFNVVPPLDEPYFVVSTDGEEFDVTEGETVEVETEITNTGEEADEQNVTFAINDVGIVDWAEVALDGESSETVSFEWPTAEGDAGSYTGAVTSEDDESNVDIDVSELEVDESDPARFTVSITDPPSEVQAGEPVDIEVTLFNAGGEEGTQVIALEHDGDQLATETVSLSSTATTTAAFTWETDGVEYGQHDLQALSENESDVATIEVVDPDPDDPAHFDVEIDATPAPVQVGESADVDVTVTNTGDVEESQTISLVDGETEFDSATVELAGDESDAVTLGTPAWNTSGDYSVTAESEDAADSATVTVEEATFDLTIQEVELLENNTVQVHATVENTAGIETAQQISAASDGTIYDSMDLELGAGESQQVVFDWQDESAAGSDEYPIEVASETADATTTAAFELESDTDDEEDEDDDSMESSTLILLAFLAVFIGVYLYARQSADADVEESPESGSEDGP